MSARDPTPDPHTTSVVVSRHLERLTPLIEKYREWCDVDNDAEAAATVIADAKLLLRDLDADPDEVERFVTALNRHRTSRHPESVEVPDVACDTTLADLSRRAYGGT